MLLGWNQLGPAASYPRACAGHAARPCDRPRAAAQWGPHAAVRRHARCCSRSTKPTSSPNWLGEGLPTVEAHRNVPPLFQAVALVDAGVDDVYLGDPALTEHSWARLGSFVRDDVVLDGVAATRRCRGHDPVGALAGALCRLAAA
ncbi:MupG family TIM beta-alpha barrel fold protein [Curtobacterium sp. L3-7]|uniref:MupG family TIM beta-alpha barrel fold protein n=1 Tax=Curtobacterium sp. L3-7 TaxID=3138787 RepID=UPI003B51AB28